MNNNKETNIAMVLLAPGYYIILCFSSFRNVVVSSPPNFFLTLKTSKKNKQKKNIRQKRNNILLCNQLCDGLCTGQFNFQKKKKRFLMGRLCVLILAKFFSCLISPYYLDGWISFIRISSFSLYF